MEQDDLRCIEPARIERDMFERQWWGEDGKPESGDQRI
jgi:hypothetical protein